LLDLYAANYYNTSVTYTLRWMCAVVKVSRNAAPGTPKTLKVFRGHTMSEIFTGTLDSSPFRGPNALLDFV